MIILLSRYLQDTATAYSDQPASALAAVSPWDRARGQAREALHNAAAFLLPPDGSRPAWPAASASPLARHLDEAARCLAAGRDLLYTHFTQLAYWTGRLTYTDPTWTLATGPHATPRTPEELAPAPEDLPQVIAAVHHTAEALALLADTEHEQLHHAVRARRIFVPTRTLPGDHDIPRPYAPALAEDTRTLLAAYRDTTHAARHTATAAGRAAQAEHAPSRILANARQITHTSAATPAKQTGRIRAPARERQPDIAGPLQHTLASLGITDPDLLTRGRDLDHASQRLLIDAADHLPPAPHQPPATTVNKTPATAAILNHALATGEPRAVRLLRQPGRTGQDQPAPEPEPEA